MTEFQTPPNPAHFICCNGRVYDLTALETPFGLLPEPVQEALKEWPHGVEMMTYSGQMVEYNFPNMTGKRGAVWRAKPAPVVKSYELHWHAGSLAGAERYVRDTHIIIITGPDGGPYTATVEALK